MKIAEGVATLELTMSFSGTPSVIHPTLVWDETNVLLFDTGTPGQSNPIREEIERLGIDIARLDKVVLTHQDIDHIGSMPKLREELPQPLEVFAHAEDKPSIEGEKPILKMSMLRQSPRFDTLPESFRAIIEHVLASPPVSKVDTLLADGEKLPYCGGITAIHTPGHTPGHLSFYLHASKVLIAGDALMAADGKLIGPNESATPDMPLALASLRKLLPYDIETVVCYHGGVVTGAAADIRSRLEELAG